MRKSVILRDMAGGPPAAAARGPAAPGARSFDPALGRAQAPELRVDVAELTPAELADTTRDPKVVGWAPVMPTSLIQPRAGTEAAAGGDAWGIAAVGADQSAFTGGDVVVAVLDTGIDPDHPAFAGVELERRNFTDSGDDDAQGHGTHCAGTIFGRDVDGGRIGVARGVQKALIGKVLGDDGGGTNDMLFQGITWAVEAGASVISMSLGFDFPGLVAAMTSDNWPVDLATSRALEAYRANLRMFDALMGMVRAREAFGAGAVVVAASGNESRREVDPDYEIAVSLPAASEGVVSVGAVGQGSGGFTLAPFSNTFPELSGPGVDIRSAKVGGGTAVLSGTSMACPHVAGVAALWWEAIRAGDVPATAKAVVARLLATARTDVFAPGVEAADRGGGLVTAP